MLNNFHSIRMSIFAFFPYYNTFFVTPYFPISIVS